MSEKKEVIDTFKRVEDKYRMSPEQVQEFLRRCGDHIMKDYYFQYTVRSIYFDSVRKDLVINSLKKDKYKMKLRLRTYTDPKINTPVFLETKKKYGDIVYKKRITIPYQEALDYVNRGIMHSVHSNTAGEIDYLMKYYHLKPAVMIMYDRKCYSSTTEKDVRITFDSNIRYTLDHMTLSETGREIPLNDAVMMEIKAMDRYPIWLVKILSEMKLYKQGFSKYGTIYSENYNRMKPKMGPVYRPAYNAKEINVCSTQY